MDGMTDDVFHRYNYAVYQNFAQRVQSVHAEIFSGMRSNWLSAASVTLSPCIEFAKRFNPIRDKAATECINLRKRAGEYEFSIVDPDGLDENHANETLGEIKGSPGYIIFVPSAQRVNN